MTSIFTKIILGEAPAYKVAEEDGYLAFLDISPLKLGHTLVISKKKVDKLFDLDQESFLGLMKFAREVAKALEKVVLCKRIGLSVMGFDVAHAHIHLVPMNQESDLNFSQDRIKLSTKEMEDISKKISGAFYSENPLNEQAEESKKLILMILDGWGIPKNPLVSAINKANTPFIDSCYKNYPHAFLEASGLPVGLPDGQMGNSEVGHMHLGAGRVIYQNLVRINNALKDGTLKENKNLNETLEYVASHGKNLHIMGLLSDGGVHSHIDHLFGLLDIIEARNTKNVFIHVFTDGRDTDPKSGRKHLGNLVSKLKGSKAKLASVTGRYYAMDRDSRWERVKLAYDAMVHGKGEPSLDIVTSLENSYQEGLTDEFIKPIIAIDSNKEPIGRINSGDALICFNFRSDRAREITQALTQEDFAQHAMRSLELHYLTMTIYDHSFKNLKVIFESEDLKDTLGEVLEKHGKTQLRIAETEKYPHVTFFFSGGRETPFEGEKRILCPSPKVATYDLKPEMSAQEICDKAILEIQTKKNDFICLNFANPDMVGHTGIMEAAIKACEVVDNCAESICQEALENNYAVIILADHGNADCMINPDNTPHTAHTTQPVPFFFLHKEFRPLLKNGSLADIAPSILDYMRISKPKAMKGDSLLSN